MSQDRESGAAANAYGLRMGKVIARLIGAQQIAAGSNEADWNGRRIVIKTCASATDSFGITTTMMPGLDQVVVAVEQSDGSMLIYERAMDHFTSQMRDSLSRTAKGQVKQVRRRVAEQNGRFVAHFYESRYCRS